MDTVPRGVIMEVSKVWPSRVQLGEKGRSAQVVLVERNKDAGRAVPTAVGISFLCLYGLEAQTVPIRQPASSLRVQKEKERRWATEPDTLGRGRGNMARFKC